VLWLPPNFNSYFNYERPRKGNWSYEVEVNVQSGGLAGNSKVGYSISFEPTYFISDAFSVFVALYGDRNPDWLVWQADNLIGSFEAHEMDFDAGLNWTIGSRQELRVKLRAIGLEGRLLQAYRVDSSGSAVPSSDPVENIRVNTLGFQIRYRYELAPLSYLYVVYGRGGFDQDPAAEGAGGLLRDSFQLRDDEQLLVKFSYRFET
jgi:hypothetical protein